MNSSDQQLSANGNSSRNDMPNMCHSSYITNYISDQPVETLAKLPNTLAVLPYGTSCVPSHPGIINTGLTSLGEKSLNEVWSVNNDTISKGVSERCHWSKTDKILSAAIWLTAEDCQDIEGATEIAYKQLLNFIQSEGYPHPLRFWNYIPDINLGEDDKEHYKLFCTGRLKAFRRAGIPDDQFPSASALGHHAEGAVIYTLSAKKPGKHHNNSLQVNAYQYPREYGVSSPSFSRATCITLAEQDLFFVSGTASIIGHQTTHEGDLSGQLETTISNIRHLLDNKNKTNNNASLKTMKVYLRYASDYIAASQHLNKAFPDTDIIFTLADVCRANLLVEVECFCG